MVAFLARTHEVVHMAHEIAVEHGGSSDGAPGLRPEYHEHYYATYLKDPEGNKFCVVCHDPELNFQ